MKFTMKYITLSIGLLSCFVPAAQSMQRSKSTLISKYRDLEQACTAGNVAEVKSLLRGKGIALLNQRLGRDDQWSPLHIACAYGHTKLVQFLLTQEGIRVNQVGSKDETPLHIVCAQGNVAIGRLLLLANGIKINRAADRGTTPFYIACEQGHVDMVHLLLSQQSIERDTPNHGGFSPLHIACENGRADVVKLLLDNGANTLNQPTVKGITPLYIACENGHASVVKILLDTKLVDLDACIEAGAFYTACEKGHVQVVMLLLNACSDRKKVISAEILHGATALHAVVYANNAFLLRLFLRELKEDAKAVINNARYSDESTVLHWAIELDRVEMVRILLEAGADINEVTEDFLTPLDYAYGKGNADIIELLESHGARKYVKPLVNQCVNAASRVARMQERFEVDCAQENTPQNIMTSTQPTPYVATAGKCEFMPTVHAHTPSPVPQPHAGPRSLKKAEKVKTRPAYVVLPVPASQPIPVPLEEKSYVVVQDPSISKFRLDAFFDTEQLEKISELEKWPNQGIYVKKLTGKDEYKLRIDKFRILFRVDTDNRQIVITKVGARKNIYKH